MIIRILGYANAQALFDYFNGQGVTWAEPTNKKSAWHTIRINIQGFKDNAQHVTGLLIGTVSRKQYKKEDRASRFFSTVAVTLAQEGIYQWFPYKMLIVKK